MFILIDHYKTVHTIQLSEMTDKAGITPTCDLRALVVIAI